MLPDLDVFIALRVARENNEPPANSRLFIERVRRTASPTGSSVPSQALDPVTGTT